MPDTPRFGQVSAGDTSEHVLSSLSGAPGSSSSGIMKLKAPSSNAGIIYISHTVATAANGWPLAAGQELTLEIINPGKLHIIQTVAGDKLAWHTLSA